MISPHHCQISYIRAKETHSLARVPILDPCIIWVRQGTKKLFWQGEQETISQGGVIILPAQSEFYITNIASEQGYLAEVISLPSFFVNEFTQRQPPATMPAPPSRKHFGLYPNKHTQAALINLIQSIHEKAPNVIQQGYAHVLLLALAENGHTQLFQPINNFAEQVKQHIINQPQKAWSVSELANHFHMSQATFRRRLSLEKQGFRKILDDVRLGVALSKIQQTKMTVNEVTSMVGYQCASQFSAKFKRRFGVSPSELRKSL